MFTGFGAGDGRPVWSRVVAYRETDLGPERKWRETSKRMLLTAAHMAYLVLVLMMEFAKRGSTAAMRELMDRLEEVLRSRFARPVEEMTLLIPSAYRHGFPKSLQGRMMTSCSRHIDGGRAPLSWEVGWADAPQGAGARSPGPEEVRPHATTRAGEARPPKPVNMESGMG